MLNRIGLVTIVTNNLEKMKTFFTNVLDFEVIEELEGYVEFKNDGVRFAITTNDVMYNATQNSSYIAKKSGQRFELAFPLENPNAIKLAYDMITRNGALPISPPEMMPWGRMTAFFADPDGNIHELYSLKEDEEKQF